LRHTFYIICIYRIKNTNLPDLLLKENKSRLIGLDVDQFVNEFNNAFTCIIAV